MRSGTEWVKIKIKMVVKVKSHHEVGMNAMGRVGAMERNGEAQGKKEKKK